MKRKARPWIKNWHARQLGATSKKVCNMQAITCFKMIAYWYWLKYYSPCYTASAFAKSQPNALLKGWWLWRTKTVALYTWTTRAFNAKLTLYLALKIFIKNILKIFYILRKFELYSNCLTIQFMLLCKYADWTCIRRFRY